MSKLETKFNRFHPKIIPDYFGSIRQPDEKYFPGAVHDIFVDGNFFGTAKIIAVRKFKFGQLRDVLAYLDAGMPAPKLANLLKSWYGPLQHDSDLFHCVFKWEDRDAHRLSCYIQNWWTEATTLNKS